MALTWTTIEGVAQQGKDAAVGAIAQPWFEWMGRLGYGAKGLVYLAVGGLAGQVAGGLIRRTPNPGEAFLTLATHPLGALLLSLIALGLAGYALWNVVQAVMNPEQHAWLGVGLIHRIAYAVTAIGYGWLARKALEVLGGGDGDAGDRATKQGIAMLLAQPYGPWLVGLIGLVVLGVAAHQFYQVYTAPFCRWLKVDEMHALDMLCATHLCRFGLAARAVVHSIISVFLLRAALTYNAEEAKGLGGALEMLAAPPYGMAMMGLGALGFIAYGVYCLVEARYRHIPSARS